MAAPAVPACGGGNLRERRLQVPSHLEWRRDGLGPQLWRRACGAARLACHLLEIEVVPAPSNPAAQSGAQGERRITELQFGAIELAAVGIALACGGPAVYAQTTDGISGLPSRRRCQCEPAHLAVAAARFEAMRCGLTERAERRSDAIGRPLHR